MHRLLSGGNTVLMTILAIAGVCIAIPSAIVAWTQINDRPTPTPIAKVQPAPTFGAEGNNVPSLTRQPSPLPIPTEGPTKEIIPTDAPTPTKPKPTAKPIPTDIPQSTECVSGNVLGKVASEVPGTPLCIGESVTSSVDGKLKTHDVYSLALNAGDILEFALTDKSEGCMFMNLFPPDVASVKSTNAAIFEDQACSARTRKYTVTTSGIYYLAVTSNAIHDYVLSVTNTGETVPTGILSDVPGTPLELGQRIESSLDGKLKTHDVFAIPLTAGNTVQFALTDKSEGCMFMNLFPPDVASVKSTSAAVFEDQVCSDRTHKYTVTTSGIYYLAVTSNAIHDYALLVTAQ